MKIYSTKLEDQEEKAKLKHKLKKKQNKKAKKTQLRPEVIKFFEVRYGNNIESVRNTNASEKRHSGHDATIYIKFKNGITVIMAYYFLNSVITFKIKNLYDIDSHNDLNIVDAISDLS